MKEKLKRILENKIALDVLKFFHQNQSSLDSVGGVSAWVHGDRKEVRLVLEKLVKVKVLERDSTGGMEGYCYTRDEKTMKIVDALISDV